MGKNDDEVRLLDANDGDNEYVSVQKEIRESPSDAAHHLFRGYSDEAAGGAARDPSVGSQPQWNIV